MWRARDLQHVRRYPPAWGERGEGVIARVVTAEVSYVREEVRISDAFKDSPEK